MYLDFYKKLYSRDITKIIQELKDYPDEESLWITYPAAKNSAGTLAQHIIGNLNHYIGKHLGGTSYIRNRDAEFNVRQFERIELIKLLNETEQMIINAFNKMNDEDLKRSYSTEILNFNLSEQQTINDIIVALSAHLNYHLGQINYHRRLGELI